MSLKEGCYLVSFKPNRAESASEPPAYVGTLRVAKAHNKGGKNTSGLRASGDLYRLSAKARKVVKVSDGWKATAPRPSGDIPVFPLSDYAYYLDILSMNRLGTDSVLEIQARKFDPSTRKLSPGGTCQLLLKPGSEPGELTGTLVGGGEERGAFCLRWISEKLRRAQLRIFLIQPGVKKPIREPKVNETIREAKATESKRIPNLKEIFGAIGWHLNVSSRQKSGAKFNLGDEPWAPYDLSAVALRLREDVNSDADWVYDLMCVSQFESGQYLGIMFDSEAVDLNRRPRETAAVAARQQIIVEGTPKYSQDAFEGRLYYRTALHELGHAMNLAHNLRGKTLMNTTEFLLSVAPPDPKAKEQPVAGFAGNFEPEWDFDAADKSWLQHAPDIAVRPGGISRHDVRWQGDGRQQVVTLSFYEPPSLALEVRPVAERFPLGAPVRLNYTLANHGESVWVPGDISLRGGHISGRVTGHDRETRYFRSAFRCCDSIFHQQRLQELTTGELEGGMTLLRGLDGPLFPEAGSYKIELEMRWDAHGRTNRVVGRTNVVVEEVNLKKDPEHAMVAGLVLSRPSMMPAIVQGYLDEEGAQLLSYALNSPTLAPHYLATAIKCKIMGTQRGQDWDALLAGGPEDKVKRSSGITSDSQQSDSQSSRNGALFPEMELVHTARERSLWEARSDKDEIVSRIKGNRAVIAHEVFEWLLRVQEITRRDTPAPTASLFETAGLLRPWRQQAGAAGKGRSSAAR